MFIGLAANLCLALHRSATFRGDYARSTTFRSSGAENFRGPSSIDISSLRDEEHCVLSVKSFSRSP